MDTHLEHKMLQNNCIVNTISRLKSNTLISSANNMKMKIYLVNIWNWQKGQIIGVIKGHTSRITKVYAIED